MERTLAHGLISNVFPRGVSASLIELFERYSHDPDNVAVEEELSSKLRAVSVQSERPPSRHDPPPEPRPIAICDSTSSICLHPDVPSRLSLADVSPVTPPERAKQRLHALVGRNLAPRKHRAIILFGDIVGFTSMASLADASTLVEYLDSFFGQVRDFSPQFPAVFRDCLLRACVARWLVPCVAPAQKCWLEAAGGLVTTPQVPAISRHFSVKFPAIFRHFPLKFCHKLPTISRHFPVNHLEERFLDQAQARASYTPLFWGRSRSIPPCMVSNV